MLRQLVRHWMTGEARAVLRSILEPEPAQRATFRRLQRSLRGSELARHSGWSDLRTLEECRSLRQSDADTLKPWFEEAFRRGDAARGLFGSSRISAFARTSGTIEAKVLPLNARYFASYDRSLARLSACRFQATGEWETLLAPCYLNIGSRAYVAQAPCGLPVGDISGLLPTRSSWVHRRVCLPRNEDLFIADWERKVNRILDQARRQPVHTISGVPALVLDFARRAKARFGVETLTALWPRLRWFLYGGYALSAEERQAIEVDWCGRTGRLHFVEAYFASEGALGFSVDPADPALALNLLEHVFVFLPVAGGAPRLAHEVAAGATYALAITTPGGLVNYRIGDRVRIETVHPLRVRVVGREQDELSMTGEHLTLAQLDAALARAGYAAGAPECWTMFWADAEPRPHLCCGYPAACPAPEAVLFDRALADSNPLFAEARFCENLVGASRMVPIPLEVYASHRAPALGIGQFKPRRIFPSVREFAAVHPFSPPAASAAPSARAPTSESSAST